MGPSSPPPFSLSCKTPIAYGSAIAGRHKHGVLYIPTGVIKDVVGAYMSTMRLIRAMSSRTPAEPPKALEGEDF